MQKLSNSNTAILVIDMINEYLTPEGKMYCEPCRSIIDNLSDFLKQCLDREVTVYFLCNEIDNPRNPLAQKWGMHAEPGSTGAQVIDELQHFVDCNVIKKHVYDGFFETGLHNILSKRGIKNVAVCGIHTHVCVLATALGAFYRGYGAYVISDCITTEKKEKHLSRLDFFDSHIGRLITSTGFLKLF